MDFTPKFNPKIFQVLLRDLARHEKFNARQLWEDEKEKFIGERKQENNNKNKHKNKHAKHAKAKISNKERVLQKIQENKQKKQIEKDLDFIKNSLIIHTINMEEFWCAKRGN